MNPARDSRIISSLVKRTTGPLGRHRRLLCALLLVGFIGAETELVLAERYLTLAEAQKLCFPQAEQYETQTIRITPEQAKQIEKRSGAKVYHLESRIWLARREDNILGVLFVDQVLGKHELIDYVVAIAPSGKVLQVEVLEYRESHGSEIRGAKWRAQFQGKTVQSPLKLNKDIYNISGATISCRHVTEGVKRVLAIYEVVGRPRLLAAHKLPDAK